MEVRGSDVAKPSAICEREVERDDEDEARAYLSAHGEWPDETPEQVDA
jgi:hypothetical protein